MTSRLLISEMHGLASRADELERLLDDLAEAGRAENRCSMFSIVRRQDLGEFVVIAHWRDEAALREHYQGAPYARYRAAVGERVPDPAT
jgi:quinol monooxygenase YgiN